MATAQIPWNDGSGHNMSVEWDGTQDGEIKISSPTNPSLTEQRTKSIQVQTTAGSPQVTRTITVVQEAAVYTYEYSVIASSSDILPASGGSVTYTAQLKTYLQGDLLKTETVTPVCRIVSGTGFSASGNRVTAANRGTEYSASQRSAQVAVEFVAPETGETLSETATVNQAANSRVIVYSKPNITDVSANDIPASGGSISSANVSYSQSRHYYYDSGATENLSALTTGGTINYGDPVTASSRGTTVGDRQFAGTLTFTVSMNGQTSAEQDVSVYQEANAVESVTPEIVTGYYGGMGAESAPLSAGGGGGSYGLEVTLRKVSAYSSGSTVSEVTYMGQNPDLFEQVVSCESDWLTAGYFSSSTDIVTFTWQSRGTVAGEKRCSYIELDWEGVHKEIPVWQAANAVESTVADIVLSPSKGDDINDILPASGYSGGLSCNITVKDTYTSGSVDSYTPTPSGPNDTSHLAMLSSSASWLHVNDTISGNGGSCPMSADDRGTVEGSERSAVITATYRGSQGTVTVWQEENIPSNTYEIEIGFYDGDSGTGSESNPVPASGGSVGLSVDVHVQHNFPSGAVTSGEETPSAGFWQTAELAGWMTGQLVGDVYGITVAANTGAARSGTVLFKHGGAIGTMTIYQAGVSGGSYELKFTSHNGIMTAQIVSQVSGMPVMEALTGVGSGDWFGDFTYEEASEIVEQVMATGYYVEMRAKS